MDEELVERDVPTVGERLRSAREEKGLALVPLDLHFSRGYVKVTLAVARGRKLHDKREALKRREQDREARRAVGATRGAP